MLKRFLPILLTALAFLIPMASANAAAPAGPGWTIDSYAAPTHFPASGSSECLPTILEPPGSELGFGGTCDRYWVAATNAGSEPTSGAVTLTDTPSRDLAVQGVSLHLVTNPDTTNAGGQHIGGVVYTFGPYILGQCLTSRSSCTIETAVGRETYRAECFLSSASVRCTVVAGVLPPGLELRMDVLVTVNAGTPEHEQLTNSATVSGGGAASASIEASNEVSSTPAPFGLSRFEFFKAGLNGSQETQAGGHPYELTTTIDLDDVLGPELGQGTLGVQGVPQSSEKVKDIVVDLPLGFAGSTLAAPQCTEAQLDSLSHCPPATVVGHLTTEPVSGVEGGTTINGPIWNIVPQPGHPAEFGYIDLLEGAHVAGYVNVVPTPAGYVLRFVSSELPEVPLARIIVTFYGDPALKDAEALQHKQEEVLGVPVPLQTPSVQVPFFTNPTACSNGPQVASIWVDSWEHPARLQPGSGGLVPVDLQEAAWAKMTSTSPPVTGCNALTFTPEIGAQPTTHEADKPTGLEFGLELPQTESVGTNATPSPKNIRVTFPEGMTVDPSSADGLGTCTNAQIGYVGPTLFDFTEGKPECPESSKIGSLELETPLIPGVLHGEMFLAAQNENPFGSTFATYVVVNDPVTGVVLKIAGELKLNPSTGRIESVFDENPQLPFSSLKLHFSGGPRAPLATPNNCGIYQTSSVLEPWSFPDSGPLATPFDDYVIDEDCQTGFAPHFTGGSTNLAAGAYTTFQASFERQDNEPELGGATINLPPGLLANVGSVSECGEAEIQAEREDRPGGCPESSKVGTTTAGAGPGPNPLFVGGNVYWTGPYNGHGACTPGSEPGCAPFGLAVVVSANPGPFHFGNVVVRQRLFINKETAAATDVSDPFPTFLHVLAPNGETNGVPIKLRRVDVEISGRAGHPFTFNPTSCAHMQVAGDISSTQGQSSALATPFQVTNCAALPFDPQTVVSTSGKTSKADGASLHVKIDEGTAGEANAHYVKVELPKALPSRLTTLQKACTQAQFRANPAGCPAASVIGHAVAHTPVLPVPVEGPVYFVSNGGEAFPNLVMVLQGDGVTIDVVGDTFISKSGITSSTFKTVPDARIGVFELTLPEGKYSALAANGNLCTQKLAIPTEFVGQNGKVYKQTPQIGVEGCKPAITVVKHSVKGKTATLVVSVPAAGKLVASGKGVSKGTGKSGKAQDVTVEVTLSKADQALLARHHLRKALVHVKLVFTPKKGSKLSTSVQVSVG
jgi:hypothetical protein